MNIKDYYDTAVTVLPFAALYKPAERLSKLMRSFLHASYGFYTRKTEPTGLKKAAFYSGRFVTQLFDLEWGKKVLCAVSCIRGGYKYVFENEDLGGMRVAVSYSKLLKFDALSSVLSPIRRGSTGHKLLYQGSWRGGAMLALSGIHLSSAIVKKTSEL